MNNIKSLKTIIFFLSLVIALLFATCMMLVNDLSVSKIDNEDVMLMYEKTDRGFTIVIDAKDSELEGQANISNGRYTQALFFK